MKTKDSRYIVYRHTSPSGKVYIGITHHENPNNRYGKGGKRYKPNVVFWKAIEKYGWDNFIHEVLYFNLSEPEAMEKEKELIKIYKDKGISYNMTIGGEGRNMECDSGTAEYRTAVSRKYRTLHPEWDRKQYLRHAEQKKQLARAYYAKHREEVLAYKRKAEVLEKARIRSAAWREKNPDYMKKYMKEYNKTHKKKKQNE